MQDDDLMQRVAALRAEGHSPKNIARALRVRPSTVAPLGRKIACDNAAMTPEAAVVGCWVSPGWSLGLTIEGDHDWPDAPANGTPGGLVSILVARQHRRERVSVCGYLVDVYCLGVKDALGPRRMDLVELATFRQLYFRPFDAAPLAAPIELARHLVFGAVEYARRLGFEPAPDFAPVADHLGPLSGPSAIRFGCDGKPMFNQGPYDDADRIMQVLEESVGMDNFDFLVAL